MPLHPDIVAHLQPLQACLGAKGRLITDETLLTEYNRDYRANVAEGALLSPVCIPITVEQVQAVIRYVSSQPALSILLQGGKTSLVAGSVPMDDSASLILKPEIAGIEVDADAHTVTVGTQATLEHVQTAVEDAGFHFPLNYGSKGTATAAAATATNAGGMGRIAAQLLRSVEMVDGNANIHHFTVNDSSKLVTDSTLPNQTLPPLASQGWLGAITHVTYAIEPKPNQQITALLAFDTIALLHQAHKTLRSAPPVLSIAEMIYGSAWHYSCELTATPSPIRKAYPYYLLLQWSSPLDTALEPLVEEALASLMTDGICADAVLAHSGRQEAELIHLREGISDAIKTIAKQQGCAFISSDIGFPQAAMQSFLPILDNIMQSVYGAELVAFGHLQQKPEQAGAHYNLILSGTADLAQLTPEAQDIWHACGDKAMNAEDAVIAIVYYFASLSRDETIRSYWTHSLEHGGLGIKTLPYTLKYLPLPRLNVLSMLKQTYDPQGVFHRSGWQYFTRMLKERVDASIL